MVKKTLYALLLFLSTAQIQPDSKKDLWVTVFIHGSFSLRPHLNPGNILKMLNDSIEESVYYRSTEINRRDPFFYKNQAMGDIGLHKINIHKPTTSMAAPNIAQAFEEISQHAGQSPSEEYYTFGWSGLVSNKLRYIEANFLYEDLYKLVQQLRSKGYEPKLRLIGYSHGGNIGLQLGALHQTKSSKKQINIEEFHLLGTPIQVETDYLINSPIFKKVYNWYSRGDGVQSLDFFSFKRLFSRKKFSKRKNFTLPEKLTQIRIKVSNFKLKTRKKTPSMTPTTDSEINKYYKQLNFDPGHFELWFMGWTILTYRKEFPTNPLPIMIFIPLVTKYLQQQPHPQDLVVDFKPLFNKIDIYPYRSKHKKHFHLKKPFIESQMLKKMQKHALLFTPDNYNIETYNRKVYDAIKIVDHELSEIKRLTKLDEKNQKKLDKVINLHASADVYEGHLPLKKKNVESK